MFKSIQSESMAYSESPKYVEWFQSIGVWPFLSRCILSSSSEFSNPGSFSGGDHPSQVNVPVSQGGSHPSQVNVPVSQRGTQHFQVYSPTEPHRVNQEVIQTGRDYVPSRILDDMDPDADESLISESSAVDDSLIREVRLDLDAIDSSDCDLYDDMDPSETFS